MTDLEVLDIAKEVAGIFGVQIDERLVLGNMRSQKTLTPVVIYSTLATIWIDRQSIKLCEHDDIDIIYIYVTRQHAKEELHRTMDLLRAVDTQNEFISLLGIVRQLRRALKHMESSGADYYVLSGEISW